MATLRAAEWFVAFSMCILAILKLRDLETFSNMFLGYDLLAQRYVRYAYIYPFGEVIAGVLMIAGAPLKWIAIPMAFVIGSIGAVSVFKAVATAKLFAEIWSAQPGQPHRQFAERGRPEGIRLPGEHGISRQTTAQGRRRYKKSR